MVLDTRKSNFVNQQWLQFHIWFIMTLYYKMRQILLQNETIVLLQNVSDCFPQNATVFITNSDSYYKMRQIYYERQRLLQNALFITKCVGTDLYNNF